MLSDFKEAKKKRRNEKKRGISKTSKGSGVVGYHF